MRSDDWQIVDSVSFPPNSQCASVPYLRVPLWLNGFTDTKSFLTTEVPGGKARRRTEIRSRSANCYTDIITLFIK